MKLSEIIRQFILNLFPYPQPPKYTFDYAVKDDYYGANFNAQESRDGYNTQGAYYVALPDGRTQKVTYYVDGDSGYVAEVSYEGEAQYPEQQSYQPAKPSYKPAPQPSYKPAPKPSYQPAPQPSYQPAPIYG